MLPLAHALCEKADTGCATYVLQSRGPWDELAHRLGNPAMPLAQAEQILFESVICIEGCVEGLKAVHEHDFLGLLVGIYRSVCIVICIRGIKR